MFNPCLFSPPRSHKHPFIIEASDGDILLAIGAALCCYSAATPPCGRRALLTGYPESCWISLCTRAPHKRAPHGAVARWGPSSCAISPTVSSWWARSGRWRVACACAYPPPSGRAAAPVTPLFSLYTHVLRKLDTLSPQGCDHWQLRAMAPSNSLWLARSDV